MVPELYSVAGQPRRKFSLDEVRTLLEALGNPHRLFRSILIAGTNGKGSTAATLSSILKASGHKVGLYTSPHLERPNERIRVDGYEIGDDDFARLFFVVMNTAKELLQAEKLPKIPSYFEILTALAFLYFAESKIEIAVLEVGMGGRLDATNVVDPLLSIITDISLDHTEWLGPTIAAITREKAGILRPGGTMITLPQHPEANQVLGEVATDLDVHAINAAGYLPTPGAASPYVAEVLGAMITVDSPLAGVHQRRNVALAIAAAVVLGKEPGFTVTPASIELGIRQTIWPGRVERFASHGVEWILDVAHNPAGAWALRAALSAILTENRPRILVFSCLRDKPLDELAQILFPLFDRVILAPIHSARAATQSDLLKAAQQTGSSVIAEDSVADALARARELAAGGIAVVSGSVYLVGEARTVLLGAKGKTE